MNNPTKLVKGQLIDTQNGFVDTFNWLVDFCKNLKGDNQKIELQNPSGHNPQINFKDYSDGSDLSSSSSGITIVGTDGTTATCTGNLSFQSAGDSNLSVTIAGDLSGNVTATIGVYYI